MKKILFNTGLAVLLLSGFTACNKLEYTPQQSLLPSDLFKTPEGVQSAVIGCYSLLQGNLENDQGDFSFDIIAMPECFSDDAIFSGTFLTRQEFSKFNISTANLTNQGIYDILYASAVRTNDVIDRIQAINNMTGLTTAQKNTYLSELYTIRAYAYFYLSVYYGNVPLVLQTTNTANLQSNNDQPNTPQPQIMAQIEKDLLWADSNIGAGGGSGAYVSHAAIEAFLARFYLYNGSINNDPAEIAKAKTYSEDVIANSGHTLDPSYDNIFANPTQSPEVIWYENYNSSNGNSIAFYFFSSSMGGRQEVSVRTPNMFADDTTQTDLREASTIVNGNVVYKYRHPGDGADPVILFRLGEQYLIAAEAEAREGNFLQADTFLNAIRQRAGLSDTTMNANDYLDIILTARRKELAFEMGGFRLLDLRRTGRAAQVLGPLGYTAPKCDLWPFPQADMDANPNLKQNTGY